MPKRWYDRRTQASFSLFQIQVRAGCWFDRSQKGMYFGACITEFEWTAQKCWAGKAVELSWSIWIRTIILKGSSTKSWPASIPRYFTDGRKILNHINIHRENARNKHKELLAAFLSIPLLFVFSSTTTTAEGRVGIHSNSTIQPEG